ncbi:MarR family winged helix-turn-helix transcriptional regulator [Glycomyces salinus]|uniref:MarR family winged helix-turn-helix transcriptional regulator n=1 Tax=Glycomyces salinus TaxID=980294 RepID=UPI0018ECBF85|nr:MarR family transcriptional regulator [Glycomyces salinus]
MNDEAPWLDDDEMTTWLGLIGVVMRLPVALDEQLRRDARMSHFEFGVLAHLEHAEDQTMRMSDLAFLSNGSLSRLSHVAKRLEDEGLIERFACPSDGRSTLARLTDGGRRRLAEAAPGHVRLVRELVFDQLDEGETAELGRIAGRLLERLKQ